MPAKENSREWAWALQQNIMGLRFEHTQLILKHTQHGHLGIAGENHMIFPQLIFIFNFLSFSFSTSTLLSLLLMKFLIHKKKKKRVEGILTKVTPPLGSLQLDQPLLDYGLRLIGQDCLVQPFVLSNWWLQLSLHSNCFYICANALLLSA